MITPTSVRVSSDGEYLQFEIDKDNICQGNAVIAVSDQNRTVLWSWHIWVTDHVLTSATAKKVVNLDGVSSYLMPLPLGYCDKDYRESPNRIFKLVFEQQDPDGQIASVSFKQDSIILDMKENSVCYQWGRKDPFPGCYREGDINDPKVSALDKPCYDVANGQWNDPAYYEFGFSKTKPNMGTAIQRPNIFYNSNNNNWNNVNAPNYWNVSAAANATWRNINNNPVVKALYDPCPVGWVMPKNSAYTGFTSTGTAVDNRDGSFTNTSIEGIYDNFVRFYTGDGSNTIDLFLFGGTRGENYTKDNVYYGLSSWFWTAGFTGTSDVQGRDLGIDLGNTIPNQRWVNPQSKDARYWGMPIYADVDDGE